MILLLLLLPHHHRDPPCCLQALVREATRMETRVRVSGRDSEGEAVRSEAGNQSQ